MSGNAEETTRWALRVNKSQTPSYCLQNAQLFWRKADARGVLPTDDVGKWSGDDERRPARRDDPDAFGVDIVGGLEMFGGEQ